MQRSHFRVELRGLRGIRASQRLRNTMGNGIQVNFEFLE